MPKQMGERALLCLVAGTLLLASGCPYPPEKTVTVELQGPDDATCTAVWEVLPTLVDAGGGYSMRGDGLPARVISIGPVASPQEFARRLRDSIASAALVEGRRVKVHVDPNRVRCRLFLLRAGQFLDRLPDYAFSAYLTVVAWWTGQSELDVFISMYGPPPFPGPWSERERRKETKGNVTKR